MKQKNQTTSNYRPLHRKQPPNINPIQQQITIHHSNKKQALFLPTKTLIEDKESTPIITDWRQRIKTLNYHPPPQTLASQYIPNSINHNPSSPSKTKTFSRFHLSQLIKKKIELHQIIIPFTDHPSLPMSTQFSKPQSIISRNKNKNKKHLYGFTYHNCFLFFF